MALDIVAIVAAADVALNVVVTAAEVALNVVVATPEVTLNVVTATPEVTLNIVVATPEVTLNIVTAAAGVANYVLGVELVVVLAHCGPPLFRICVFPAAMSMPDAGAKRQSAGRHRYCRPADT